MAIDRYLLGVLLAGVAVVPIAAASSAWRARLVPKWSGAPCVLATVVSALAAVTCTVEILGAIGLFRLAPITAALALVGSGGWYAARRMPRHTVSQSDSWAYQGGEPAPDAVPRRNGRGANFVAVAATSLVVADWSTRTVDAVHHGMTTPDTLWYHMPFAARFVQTGSITPLHFVDPGVDLGTVIPFYPANGELFHALGILFLGNDFLSPMLNMGWLALVLLAAWCVGRPFGVAPASLTGAAALMATPTLVATQPGGAYTDVVGIALWTSAVALLLNARRGKRSVSSPGLAFAALAAGLALGTKFTFVAPVGALTIGIWVVTPRENRIRQGLLWLSLVLATGGFWYGRNLVAIGNPQPASLSLGPIKLPGPPAPRSTSVATFLFDGHDWQKWFLPGLRLSLGPAWWGVLILAVAGLALVVCTSPSYLERMLALVGIVAGVAFVFTPQLLTLPPFYPNEPFNFVYNVRYSFAAVVIGLVLLPTVSVLAVPRMRWVPLGAFGLILAATQLDSTLWPIDLFSQRFSPAIRGADSHLGLLIGIIVFVVGSCIVLVGEGGFAWWSPIVAVAASIAVVGVGFSLQQLYLRDRYSNTPPLAPLYSWAQKVHDTRMAITGPFSNITYPLYGKEDTNYVQALGEQGKNGAFLPVATCEELRSAVDAGHYADVITITDADLQDLHAAGVEQTMWVSRDPSARLIYRRTIHGPTYKTVVVSVFRVAHRLDPANCSPA